MTAELLVGRLSARFERCGDRYAHEILVDGRTWLVSVEGTPDEAWPASPALQEIHEQELRNGRRAILGVGMAGRSHWSLSATPDAAGIGLRFEVACRAFQDDASLGSTYRLAEDVVPDSNDEQQCCLRCSGRYLKIAVESTARVGFDGLFQVRIAPGVPAVPWTWSYCMALAVGP